MPDQRKLGPLAISPSDLARARHRAWVRRQNVVEYVGRRIVAAELGRGS